MIIKEYRIPLPMTVEEYRIAQLYMIQVSPERRLDQVKLGGLQPALQGTAQGHGLLLVSVKYCTLAGWVLVGSDYLATTVLPAPIVYYIGYSSLHLPPITLHSCYFSSQPRLLSQRILSFGLTIRDSSLLLGGRFPDQGWAGWVSAEDHLPEFHVSSHALGM